MKQRVWRAMLAATVLASAILLGSRVYDNGEAQIYRQQSQAYNNIAQQQYRQHQQIGQALRYAPYIGRYAAPAWNAPRYVYDYRTRR